MKEKRNKKELLAVGLLVLSLVLITVGTTFAFFNYSRQGTTENKIKTGNLTFVYDESKSNDGGVSLTNAFPMSDTEGENLDSSKSGVFDFDVRAKTEGAPIHYEVYLTKVAPTDERSELPEKVVKTYLTTLNEAGEDQENGLEDEGLLTEDNLNLYSALWNSAVPSILKNEEITTAKTLYRETIAAGNSSYEKHFRYRMWIDENATEVNENGEWIYNNMTFSVKVNVYAQNDPIPEPEEPILTCEDMPEPNAPKLVQGMIPVKWDEKQSSWVKADSTNNDKSWYSYCSQKWANAVTVKEDGSKQRSEYLNAKVGEKIDIEDINTMWVWIPRYEYDYIDIQTAGGTNSGSSSYPEYLNPGEINIRFIDSTVAESSEENYKVHPAFDFGGEQLEGFWYGKFETSSKTECTAGSSAGKDCDKEDIIPQIKPNVTSWRGIRVSTAFIVSQKMVSEHVDEYGFGGSTDTHMSKNSEWGAVAYLSQSAYGKYGNGDYGDDEKEVGINKCRYNTGFGSSCSDDYTSENGQRTSTTGNITGVYDMSGGAWEYVMGVLADGNGNPRSGSNASSNSGFKGLLNNGSQFSEGRDLPDSKYYDLYTSKDINVSCQTNGECYGHALLETAGWNKDLHSFVDSSNPWVRRVGDYYDFPNSGVFSFTGYYGTTSDELSFRLVLAPVK